MFGQNRKSSPGPQPSEATPRVSDDDYQLAGFVAGTRLATTKGWRTVETIQPGDSLLTFDNGAQTVKSVTRGQHSANGAELPRIARPVNVPAGAIGNAEAMVVLPEQPVLVESDAVEALTGDPFALLPARALAGFRKIAHVANLEALDVATVHFENDELVFAEDGALMLAAAAEPGIAPLDTLESADTPPPYVPLHGEAAHRLVAAMMEEDSKASTSRALANVD